MSAKNFPSYGTRSSLYVASTIYCVLRITISIVSNPSEDHSLGTIVDTVHTLTAKWFIFGLALGLSYDTLRKIESNYRGDSLRCLAEVITTWLHNNSQASWQGLASALRLPSVGEFVLATKIATEHPSH